LLEVDRELIKKWAYLFKEYLSSSTTPPKGRPREFCDKDLRKLAYISMYWEDEPDLESIRIGLNREDYHDDIYENFINEITPLFREPPEDLNEDWRNGAIIGGMGEMSDLFSLADSYKIAGDSIVAAALSDDEVYDLICPIIYNYRHATELYLKAIVSKQKQDHDLIWLLNEFKRLLKSEFDTELPKWFEGIILSFNDFDPNGTNFRYGGAYPGEAWVDIEHMRTLISWMSMSFQKIKMRRERI
jgi:hypothetical protein